MVVSSYSFLGFLIQSAGFFDHSHFFRVVKGFLVQFGITYNNDLKNQPSIPDDPPKDPKIPFDVGVVSFAGSGPNSRTTQLFIAFGPSESLGQQKWETPVGRVVEGMEHVEAFYSYGDMPPWGQGPVQGKIHSGREYIDENFPLTDSFETCHVERLGRNDLKNEEGDKAEQTQSRKSPKLSPKLGDSDPNARHAERTSSERQYVIGGGGSRIFAEMYSISLLRGIGLITLLLVVVKLLLPSGKARNKRS